VASGTSVNPHVFPQSALSLMKRVSPALIGLVYPGLVWSIHAVSPFALALVLLASALCLYLASVLSKDARYRSATIVSYLSVGAPALYSLMGGWLDSQKWLPYRGDGVWVVLWSGLLIVTVAERPGDVSDACAGPAKLAFAHGISAAMIALFAIFHIANHLMGVFGGQVHMAVMRQFRLVYRETAIEVLLGVCVLFQVVSGCILLLRRTQRPTTGWIEVLQNASGAYLMLFFASHVSAVLRTRYLHHVDTNWIWLTADNLLRDSWSVRLVPYYFLAVFALAVHGACGLRRVLLAHQRPRSADRAFIATVAAGGVAAFAIVTAMVVGSLAN
jgi:succinate dehydrogenase/fumarate reductase cytochrome b subunit